MKKILILLLIIATLFCVLAACEKQPKYDGDPMLTVMTFNIRAVMVTADKDDNWELRRKQMVPQITEIAPDIFGLQEVRESQRDYLIKHLEGYSYVGIPDRYDPTGLFGGGCYIFYKHNRLEVKESGTYWLSKTPEVSSVGWDADSVRTAVYAVFFDKNTGKEFLFYNTHLDNAGAVSRVNGTNMILADIAARSLPTIFTGDFNVDESSDIYELVTQTMSDTKYIAETSEGEGTFHNYGKRNPPAIIDFIFATKNAFNVDLYQVQDKKINGAYTSDHYAVVAKVKLA